MGLWALGGGSEGGGGRGRPPPRPPSPCLGSEGGPPERACGAGALPSSSSHLSWRSSSLLPKLLGTGCWQRARGWGEASPALCSAPHVHSLPSATRPPRHWEPVSREGKGSIRLHQPKVTQTRKWQGQNPSRRAASQALSSDHSSTPLFSHYALNWRGQALTQF